jgi:hypothetical protein
MRVIQHPSASSLHPFVQDCIEPGSTVHTDGWQGYAGLEKKGYDHEVTSLQRRRPKEVSTLLPRVHLVVSLLKRWLAGTHQGAVSHEHLRTTSTSLRFALTGENPRAGESSFSVSCNKHWIPALRPTPKSPSPPDCSAANHHLLGPPESSAYPVCVISAPVFTAR